jgi:hypothetical protein
LGQQVLATGIFQLDEVNCDLNQIIKKQMPIFEHQKRVSGQASISNIADAVKALKYTAREPSSFGAIKYLINFNGSFNSSYHK